MSDDVRRIVEEARLEAAALLHMERQHGGHGRDGHLNEHDLAPLLAALQLSPADPAAPGEEPTWEDVWAAIGREVWKLAPQDYQDAGHRDLTFLTCWQNIMEAVHNGIIAVAALPDEGNDIEATGQCCCAGCVGMGPCDRDLGRTDD